MISTTTILFLLLVHTLGVFVSARDTITTGHFISDINGENITSAGKNFTLGFFGPDGNYSDSRRYVGIWYCKDPKTVVWVANRDNPLPDRTGIFTIVREDGELKVMDGNNTYFSTRGGSSHILPRTVKLWDSGNLVMTESGKTVWQSFDYPTDTFLPGMKMDKNLKLTSWKSPEDPGSGNFTFQQDDEGNNRYIIVKKERMTPYWKSGGASSSSFFNPDQIFDAALSAFVLPNSDNRSMGKYENVSQESQNTRVVMNSSGEIQYISWNNRTQSWFWHWSEPEDQCGVYKECGKFSSCSISKNDNKTSNCTCLQGFEAISVDDFSNECTRVSNCSKKDTFSKLNVLKVEIPDEPLFEAESEKKCIENCLWNCQCQAYSYVAKDNDTGIGKRNSRQALPDGREGNGQGCWFWTTDLFGLREGYGNDGHNLSIRIFVSHTGVANATRPEGTQYKATSISLKAMVTTIIVTVALLLLCSISYISYGRIVTRRQESRESIHRNPVLHLYDSERRRDLVDRTQFTEDDKKSIDVPFFNLESILVVTDNFSDENKLGQGGFGPVYKGKFPGGQEIAVKRLSSHSVQGLEELKNEVMLIAKLQHRNLVRLLGYCIEGDEKILLYEYMRNKSLDAFIFDRTLCILLDWGKRFDIILGIARGLLYLHQDSRLRVIHRDLKASNILLDEDMNPKISDFGLARIVGGRETEASTNRVVGTYGYMSPEYALDGLFSIKSDVFSFGVVVLEIISGKRNTGFYESQQALNLLGYAWSLWKEERALVLMDHTLAESCNKSEVLKCIIVGLLCVQEDPEDRPTMSNVVFMLGSETETLPNPKQPAFVARKRLSSTPSSSSSKPEMLSINNLTISIPEGR